MQNELTIRLRRYSRACLAERLDPDFASAVYEAADGIESRDEIIRDLSVELAEKRQSKECIKEEGE